jgi:hypothetical protein
MLDLELNAGSVAVKKKKWDCHIQKKAIFLISSKA